MNDLLVPIAIVITALLASTLAAVTGFGGAVVMLPVMVWAFGVRDAIPILTVAQLVGNLSRVLFNRKELVLPVAGWFTVGAVPMAVLGGVLFAIASPSFLQRLLGVFLLGAVLYRHTSLGRKTRVRLRDFPVLGAVFGFLSGLLGTVGPVSAPFFLAYGLVKGAYIGTEALTSVAMHVVKLTVYGGYALLDVSAVAIGMAISMVMILGSYLGTRIIHRVPERIFPLIIEGVILVSGFQFLLTA